MNVRTRLAAAMAGLLAAVLFSGCHPRLFFPAPRRTILQSDAIGAWRYAALPVEGNARTWICTLELSEDASFYQTLVSPNGRNVIRESGAWHLDHSALHLEKLIVWDENAPSHWRRSDEIWQFAASRKKPGAITLVGGLAADHSLDDELEKISAAECRLLTSVTP